MSLSLRDYVRKYFSDFRYLSSTEEPDILREFVRYEEVIKFAEQFGEDQRCAGSYDMYLRMPTEEDYLAEATRYSDGDITSYIAFIDGVKYAWKMFSTPRSKEYLENLDKNKSFDLPF